MRLPVLPTIYTAVTMQDKISTVNEGSICLIAGYFTRLRVTVAVCVPTC
jgi:hypothetical protein